MEELNAQHLWNPWGLERAFKMQNVTFTIPHV